MKESLELLAVPEVIRNSLILIGLTLRTFSTAVAVWVAALVVFVQEALPTRSPLKAAGPEVILKVAVTLATGATGSANFLDVSVVLETDTLHSLFGKAMLSVTPAAGASLVFVNVAVISFAAPGEKVWSPGGVAAADVGARVRGATSYSAATILA